MSTLQDQSDAKHRRLNTAVGAAGLFFGLYAAVPAIKEAVDKINPFIDDTTPVVTDEGTTTTTTTTGA